MNVKRKTVFFFNIQVFLNKKINFLPQKDDFSPFYILPMPKKLTFAV